MLLTALNAFVTAVLIALTTVVTAVLIAFHTVDMVLLIAFTTVVMVVFIAFHATLKVVLIAFITVLIVVFTVFIAVDTAFLIFDHTDSIVSEQFSQMKRNGSVIRLNAPLITSTTNMTATFTAFPIPVHIDCTVLRKELNRPASF